MWPPVATSLDTPEDRFLHEILNPIPCNEGAGEVFGVADERSVVYMTGKAYTSSERAIVFINFDEAIKLPGLTTRRDLVRTQSAAGKDKSQDTANADPPSENSLWTQADDVSQYRNSQATVCSQPAEYLRIKKGLWLCNRPYLDEEGIRTSPKRKRAQDTFELEQGWPEASKRSKPFQPRTDGP
jgi:hypothetical protein